MDMEAGFKLQPNSMDQVGFYASTSKYMPGLFDDERRMVVLMVNFFRNSSFFDLNCHCEPGVRGPLWPFIWEEALQ
jgi:hypothetical protein